MKYLEFLIATSVVAMVVLGVGHIYTPRSSTWVVAQGNACWVVRGNFYHSDATGVVSWVDPGTGRRVSVSGARYVEVAGEDLAPAMRQIQASRCADSGKDPAQ